MNNKENAMNKVGIIILMIGIMTSHGYAQKSGCDDFKKGNAAYSTKGNGNVDTKKLQQSFKLFEELVKKRESSRFLDEAVDDFTVFGQPAQSLDAILPQLPKGPVCIQSIRVNKHNLSFVFFSFKSKPEDQMVLEMNEKFEYLSLAKVKFRVTGKISLKGDMVKVPIILISDYPFIEGEINGVKGRLMFDTGTAHTVSLYSKKVSNAKFKTKGSGHVSSGQAFKTLTYPLIENLKIGNIFFDSIPNVHGGDTYFLENITPTVLGIVGFYFFKGYDMKIDYLRSELTFYKHKKGIENWKNIKKMKNYITSIPYFTRKRDNTPMFKINDKGVEFLVMLDTGGSKGSMAMEDKNFNKFKNNGELEDFYDEPSSYYNWNNIKINDDLTLDLYGLHRESSNPPYYEHLGIMENNTLTLAYSFFSQYITIWDTRNKIIHVFEKK